MPTKALADVTLTSLNLPGQNITVSAVVISMSPLVFEITATFGTTSRTERHTIGSEGAGPIMTPATLQAALDGYRQSVADKCGWAAHAEVLANQIV